MAATAPGTTALLLSNVTATWDNAILSEQRLVLLAWILGATQIVGAVLLARGALAGRLLVTACAFGVTAVLAPVLLRDPSAALAVLLLVGSVLVMTWEIYKPSGLSSSVEKNTEKLRTNGSALGALLVVSTVLFTRSAEGVIAALALAAVLVAALWTTAWRWTSSPHLRSRMVALVALIAASIASLRAHPAATLCLALGCLALLKALTPHQRRPRAAHPLDIDWSELFFADPARSMVLTFLVFGAVGGWLLALPISASSDAGISLTDGLFTAFSAVCVTGLVVVDTSSAFSAFGQVVILLLIQVGGLGIMTFSTAGFLLLGRRLPLKQQRAAALLLGSRERLGIGGALKAIFLVTALIEGGGFLSLWLLFGLAGDGAGMAAWRAAFTAVSAFCNAGFSLQAHSLEPYQTNAPILLVVGALIVLGGLGPLVVLEAARSLGRTKLSLNARVVLTTTTLLLVVSFLLILSIEWNRGLATLAPAHRVTNAMFQAITLRTAGFDSVDLTAFHAATLTVMLIMMFVGGSPGSTAGGIKTTTLAVLFLVLRATIRGDRDPRAGGFRIARATTQKASAVATSGLAAAIVFVLAVLLTQSLPFLETIFEVVSALGTVGLSLGATTRLDAVGKAIVIAAMLIGRIGPLTVLRFLEGKKKRARSQPPEREMAIG